MSERPANGADPDTTGRAPLSGVDPDATISQPVPVDPDATVAVPAPAFDPDATVTGPMEKPEPDPEATVSGPLLGAEPQKEEAAAVRGGDPDSTVVMPARAEPDAEATVAMPARPEPDADATVAIPTPGRRRNPFAPKLEREAVSADIGALGGLNGLIAAANPILAAVPQIRQTLRHPDPAGLRETLREQIEAFEANAGVAGYGEETVTVARYALCALLDESAAATPWGGDWAQKGLLLDLHGESAGGEKFFLLLDKMQEDSGANADLLEFFYVCLALGFEGRYREAPGGRAELQELRAKLHDLVRGRHARTDGELSERWRGVAVAARRVPHALALWGAASIAALALGAVYLAYSISLASLSDPVARELARLRPPVLAAPAPAAAVQPAPAGPQVRVSPLIADEIGRGLVAVSENRERSTIVIRTDRLFASGSARVEANVQPIILRIAQALERVPGTIVVTGHTDNVPIRSARFPSNWELSTERARSVVKLMQGQLSDPRRLKAEGLADSEPVAPNDSEANRARNRRVVIILRHVS
jgi:type VI secretion system protein ImpK